MYLRRAHIRIGISSLLTLVLRASVCSEQIIDPQVPHALRLQAILANGLVKIHKSQSEFLLGDYSAALVSALISVYIELNLYFRLYLPEKKKFKGQMHHFSVLFSPVEACCRICTCNLQSRKTKVQ